MKYQPARTWSSWWSCAGQWPLGYLQCARATEDFAGRTKVTAGWPGAWRRTLRCPVIADCLALRPFWAWACLYGCRQLSHTASFWAFWVNAPSSVKRQPAIPIIVCRATTIWCRVHIECRCHNYELENALQVCCPSLACFQQLLSLLRIMASASCSHLLYTPRSMAVAVWGKK